MAYKNTEVGVECSKEIVGNIWTNLDRPLLKGLGIIEGPLLKGLLKVEGLPK